MSGQTAENDAGVVHVAPPIGTGTMPCCGKTPLEVSRFDRMTVHRDQATCRTEAGAARAALARAWFDGYAKGNLDGYFGTSDERKASPYADPRTTEHYDRARGNLDRHGVHFLTAYVAGV